MYFDTAYIFKFYCNEPESSRVRALVTQAGGGIHSSSLAVVEFHSTLHRAMREKAYTRAEAEGIAQWFTSHIEAGLWRIIPVTDSLMRRTGTAVLAGPENLFLRAADAIHLATARELGETEVWTSDRHMKESAAWFGLAARSV